MSTRTKKRRVAGVPSTPKPWPPSVTAQAFDLNAESWMRESEPVDDPDASEELKRHQFVGQREWCVRLPVESEKTCARTSFPCSSTLHAPA